MRQEGWRKLDRELEGGNLAPSPGSAERLGTELDCDVERDGRLLCIARTRGRGKSLLASVPYSSLGFAAMSPLCALHGTSAFGSSSPAHQVGSFVRITSGRLAGLTGRLLESPESGRCLIEVPVLGTGIYLRIDSGLLEPVRD